jgi:hypothetical protein
MAHEMTTQLATDTRRAADAARAAHEAAERARATRTARGAARVPMPRLGPRRALRI